MNEILLPALDGANPLGFLAALGVLNAATDHGVSARLAWRDVGRWRPVLSGFEGDIDALMALVDCDRVECASDAALTFSYGGIRDLKPPPEMWRSFVRALALRALPDGRRSIDWVAAFATDVAVDNNGNTKPTALHFTAGQQKFLEMAIALQERVTLEDLREALIGPWKYTRELPVLNWDATTSRDYALRAADPSKEKKTGVPGADWLAIRGLPFLRTFPRANRILTTCCSGEWKTGRFRWPLWNVPLRRDVVHSLLRMPGIGQMGARLRQQRGIAVLFESAIRRSDQGGYGSFSPPAVI